MPNPISAIVCRQTNAVSTKRVDRFAIAAELLLPIVAAHFLVTQRESFAASRFTQFTPVIDVGWLMSL
jgi:hypothetical protein